MPSTPAGGTSSGTGESVGGVFRRYSVNDTLAVSAVRAALADVGLDAAGPGAPQALAQVEAGGKGLTSTDFRRLAKSLKAAKELKAKALGSGASAVGASPTVGSVWRASASDLSGRDLGGLEVATLRKALGELGLQSDAPGAAEILTPFEKQAPSARLPLDVFRRVVKEIKACQEVTGALRKEAGGANAGTGETVGTVFRRYDDGSGAIKAADLGAALTDLGFAAAAPTAGAPLNAPMEAIAQLAARGVAQLSLPDFRALVKGLKVPPPGA